MRNDGRGFDDDDFDRDDQFDDEGYELNGGSDIEFADPGSGSALRAASFHNPRNLPCPTCRTPNCLTSADRARGYQCNSCADRAEGRIFD